MRTTIDIPDPLLRRVKVLLAKRKMTLRSLVVDALEHAVAEKRQAFVLRDASAGYGSGGGEGVNAEAINHAIDEQREPASPP